MKQKKLNIDKKEKKKILILPRWYPNRLDIQLGIFIQRQLVLMQEFYNFYVVYVQADKDMTTKFEHIQKNENGFPEHIIYYKSASGPLKKITNFIRYRKAQKIGLQKMSEKFDGVHVHVPYRSAQPALKLLKIEGTPFAITEHWSGHLNGLYQTKNIIDKWLYKKILKKAKVISTVSEKLQSAFKKNTGFTSVVIPNYIEQIQPKDASKHSDHIKILSIGDIHDETKNFSGLLNAFKQALTERDNLQLTIIGGGSDSDKIHNYAKQLSIPESDLIFTGRLDHEEVLKRINDCDFYVCNSNFETFGMTVAEALYAGKPVISTRCGGPEEFVNDKNGIMIDPSANADMLVQAILRMANNYQNYNSQELIGPIELRYGKEAVQNAWLAFYDKLLS
ncbi:MAG: glycosyltransferase [Crocinitomicaceae bacterium]